MTSHEITALLEYDTWATNRTLDAVSSIPTNRYLEDLGSSHGGIHATLVHIFSADRVWHLRWTGTPDATHVNRNEIPDLSSLRARWSTLQIDLHGFLGGLDDARLAAPFSYHDLKGNPHAEPLVHQLQHLVNHSSYHRGQVVTMMRQIGATPIGTDLIGFYRSRST